MKHHTIFEDSFAGRLAEGWTWLREEPAAHRLTADALMLRALPGTLWGATNTARNFLMRPGFSIEAGLASQVTVSNAPELRGEQGGLIWYENDDTYVKLIKESLEGQTWIVMAREEEGATALVNKLPIAVESATLRLSFDGEAMVGQFRTADCEEWVTVGQCAPVSQPNLQLGVYTHGEPADTENWATFRDFKVLKAGA